MRVTTACTLVALLTSPGAALAQEIRPKDLGSILGGAPECGLVLKEDAVLAFLDANVNPTDLGFAKSLDTWTFMGREDAGRWTGLQRAAQCRAIENTARAHGFID